ncbi:anti-sigma factor domain-containing protein [Lewinella sp. IMCC34191]|uniref:anti-sigma factor n=1 Tax=Lewinella sp. IMCC34191 TaxID=2259172 RepID=UPI0013006F97|nr:anti-sigma factor [Lewinella sp. IMCC34191]
MDLTAYINSGVLELYVLDRLSPDERRRVEAYAADHPEVRAEIEQIEYDLEQYAILQGQSTPPPPAVLSNLLNEIQPPPASASPAVSNAPTPPAERSTSPVVWGLLIALALALAGLLYYFFQHQQRADELDQLNSRFSTLQEDCEQIATNYQADQEQLALLTNIDTRGVVLAGTPNAPDSRALVFYNATQGTVLFTAANLPAPPAGRQYQLWAINENGPQDLGVLDRDLTREDLLNVPFVPNTQAFAITLEVEGGQPAPNLDQLQVIGEVGAQG